MLLAVPLAAALAAAEPASYETPLLVPAPGSPKVLVQATLPDDRLGMFILDTGANVTVVSRALAERLGVPTLSADDFVTGLSGTVRVDAGVLPYVDVGGARVEDLRVVVGLEGVPEMLGGVPIDGILGNDVLGPWIVEVDYPGAVFALHEPDATVLPRSATPMRVDGHLRALVDLRTASGWRGVEMIVDTGASDLLLVGDGLAEAGDYTEGLERVFGLGGADTGPRNHGMQTTRRSGSAARRYGAPSRPAGCPAPRWTSPASSVTTS